MSDTTAVTCPLDAAQQRKNLLLFACSIFLTNYLTAPVLYIGMTQGVLLEKLNFSQLDRNLPGSVYFACVVAPVFLVWYFCKVRQLKTVLISCQLISGLAVGLVGAVLWLAKLPEMRQLVFATVLLQAVAAGAAGTAGIALLWEALGRGVSAERRGLALSLAFGIGPFLAFGASLVSQLLIHGQVATPWFDTVSGSWAWRMRQWEIDNWPFPQNFAVLHFLVLPMLLGTAVVSSRFTIPLPAVEASRPPLWEGVFGGLRNFVRSPVLRWAGICTILGYAANLIPTNLNQNTLVAMGVKPEAMAGYQMAIRFLCKGVAGLCIGWLVARYQARIGMIATIGLFAATLLWAMFAQGNWYLFTFGLFGGGELLGAYAPNYILSASPPREFRRNMVLANLLYAPTSLYGVLFGVMGNRITAAYAAQVEAGEITQLAVLSNVYQSTFAVCLGFLIAALVIALCILPSRPEASATNSESK